MLHADSSDVPGRGNPACLLSRQSVVGGGKALLDRLCGLVFGCRGQDVEDSEGKHTPPPDLVGLDAAISQGYEEI